MSKSKTDMPKNLRNKCHKAIHTATVASAAAGAIPIPISDSIPITAAQIAMVVSLGKAFGLEITNAIAKSVISLTLTQQFGRLVASNISKCIPVAGSVIGASTAAALTETLGWMIADDFYRISKGEKPEYLGKVKELKESFDELTS